MAFFIGCQVAIVNHGGGVSKKLRAWSCKHIFLSCGKNINIERKASFGSGRNIIIGDNSGIGIECVVPPDITIGSNVMMAPQCYMLSSRSHEISDTRTPMCQQGEKEVGKIIIEDDCWIGLRSIVLAGRTIKKGSVLAAGCVLHKDYPEFSIVGGNPSVLIKNRKQEMAS